MPPMSDTNSVIHQARQLVQEATVLTEKLFDKAQSYNNALILAGFGGLFALLATTKAFLPPFTLSLVALMIGTSLFVHMAHAVGSMFVMSLAMLKTAERQLRNAHAVQQSVGANTADIRQAMIRLKLHMRVWLCAWVTTVSSGFGAGVLLLYFYFKNVLQLW